MKFKGGGARGAREESEKEKGKNAVRCPWVGASFGRPGGKGGRQGGGVLVLNLIFLLSLTYTYKKPQEERL